MGIFGPLSDEEALKMIGENIDVIIQQTDEYIREYGNKKNTVMGYPGETVVWNIICKAEVEIPRFIDYDGLDCQKDLPYGNPYIYVASAILNKYINNSDKQEKKYISELLKRIRKGVTDELVGDHVRTYCDNIEKSIINPTTFDKKVIKVTAIKNLSDNLIFSSELMPYLDRGVSRTKQ